MAKENEGIKPIKTPEKPETSDTKWPEISPVYFKMASASIIGAGITLIIAGVKYVFICGC